MFRDELVIGRRSHLAFLCSAWRAAAGAVHACSTAGSAGISAAGNGTGMVYA
jgi:hypothetical protein